MPLKEFYNLPEISTRWNYNVHDLVHLGFIGTLKIYAVAKEWPAMISRYQDSTRAQSDSNARKKSLTGLVELLPQTLLAATNQDNVKIRCARVQPWAYAHFESTYEVFFNALHITRDERDRFESENKWKQEISKNSNYDH